MCVGAVDGVAEAQYAAASEGGDRPGGEVDTADPVVAFGLRCIRHEHALSEEQASGAVWLLQAPLRGRRCWPGPWGVCARRVHRCGGEATTRGVRGGQARTATSAKAPLGAIAILLGYSNCALVPMSASLKPGMPVPARVVVAPVVMSTRRIRSF